MRHLKKFNEAFDMPPKIEYSIPQQTPMNQRDITLQQAMNTKMESITRYLEQSQIFPEYEDGYMVIKGDNYQISYNNYMVYYYSPSFEVTDQIEGYLRRFLGQDSRAQGISIQTSNPKDVSDAIRQTIEFIEN